MNRWIEAKRGHMVALDSNTVTMLRRWRAQQSEERLLVGPGYIDGGYVFCKPDGTAYDPDRFSREFLRKQAQFNRGALRRAATPAGAPRPAPHLGDARAARGHRHPGRQRTAQPF